VACLLPGPQVDEPTLGPSAPLPAAGSLSFCWRAFSFALGSCSPPEDAPPANIQHPLARVDKQCRAARQLAPLSPQGEPNGRPEVAAEVGRR